MRRHARSRALVALALTAAVILPLTGTATGSAGTRVTITADPGSGPWQQVPESNLAAACGLDPALMRQADAAFGDPYTVVRHGKLCWVGGGAATTETYHVASVTKSFAATLFGMIQMRSSTLEDTDQVTEWLNWWERGRINSRAKLAHVLAMTGTCSNLALDQKCSWSYDALGGREINRLITVMNRAIQREPAAFPGVTNVQQFAQRYLFDVLGMRDSNWSGSNIAYSLNSTTQDLSRLGLLWLNRGVWQGQRLLEEKYLYRMTHPAFEDTNTGYGYLTQMNAYAGQRYSSGTPDRTCTPYQTWKYFPHAPFNEARHDYNGSPFDNETHDVGVFWASGAGGQRVSVHRALDMVITVRDDGTNDGHWRAWQFMRPAYLAHDPQFQGDEAGFCAAYQRSNYAPTLNQPWSPDADN